MEELKHLKPAIEAIYSEYPTEEKAGPKLRALAIRHHLRRFKVFAAYRLIAQQKGGDNEQPST